MIKLIKKLYKKWQDNIKRKKRIESMYYGNHYIRSGFDKVDKN